jgi:hypothetical protein
MDRISNISHNGTFDASTGKVKFGPFFDSTARTLTYDVTAPSGASGDQTFSGKSFSDATTWSIIEQEVLPPVFAVSSRRHR